MSALGPPSRRAVLGAGLGLLLARPAAAAAPGLGTAAFVDTIGVNTHLSSEPYAGRFGRFRELVAACGIRHLRDEIRPSNDLGRWRGLYDAHGIRATLLVSPATNTVEQMMTYLRAVGPHRVAAIEGQNEGDSDWFMAQPAARPTWYAAVSAYQEAAYTALRGVYGPETLPMLSPSVINHKPADVALIRDSAPFCDGVAIHAYVQGAQEPETGDAYAGLSWYLRHMRDAYKPGAPAYCTEMGYRTQVRPGGTGVSERAAALYIPRLLLNNAAAGIRRTFLYEFMDGGTDPGESEHHWGLVHNDGTPKPAYEALRNLIAGLSETGLEPPAEPVAAALPEAGPELRSLALTRGDGGSLLALWRAVRCWDRAEARDLAVAPVEQLVVPERPVGRARLLVPSAGPDWVDLPVGPAGVTVPLDGAAALLRLD